MTDRDVSGPGVWELADLVTPMAVRVAATLRIADHVAEGRTTASAIAAETGTDPDTLGRLLRHLVSVGLLTRDAVGRHQLTGRAQPLRQEHPSGARARLDLEGALGRAELAFVHLLDAVRTGQAAYPLLYGRPFWQDLAADDERTGDYDAQMGADAGAWARQLVPAFAWGSLRHVVDVGGGNGTLLAALLTAHPALRGTVLDQPATASAARATLRAAGHGDRADVVAGSFFEPLPAGAGGYLLCAILHDWDDASARAILARCAEAAGPAGRVLVVEKTGDDGESPRSDQDLRMLVYFGGRERSCSALEVLAAGAGLRRVARHPAGELSVLEFVRA